MKILIAEDQAIIREMMVTMLTGIGHIESFDTGRKALQAFEQAFKDSDPFELMILDVSMPGMSGIDFLKSVTVDKVKDVKNSNKHPWYQCYSKHCS